MENVVEFRQNGDPYAGKLYFRNCILHDIFSYYVNRIIKYNTLLQDQRPYNLAFFGCFIHADGTFPNRVFIQLLN